jgi:putative DNA methylase
MEERGKSAEEEEKNEEEIEKSMEERGKSAEEEEKNEEEIEKSMEERGKSADDKLFSHSSKLVPDSSLPPNSHSSKLVPDSSLVPLSEGGSGARAYAEAVGVYLACAVDRATNYWSSFNVWADFIVQVFGRQAIPMVWDYAECNPFSESTGHWNGGVEWIYKCLNNIPAKNKGYATQKDATQKKDKYPIVISTDPPYYDNIGYADLSDFFYIWLRRSLQNVYPKLFSTLLVPKTEELIATPHRFDGDKHRAKSFFESGMGAAFRRMRETVSQDYPLTIYYAYKQTEDNGTEESTQSVKSVDTSSSGWETMLQGLINAGFSITGTWPLRTERATGLKNSINALASSIAIVCRPRPSGAPSCARRAFQAELRSALRTGLQDLQSGNIAPVDLAQASIGPGIAVYSKYSKSTYN